MNNDLQNLNWTAFFSLISFILKQPIEPEPNTVSEDTFDLFGSDDEDNKKATKPLTVPIPSNPKGKSLLFSWFSYIILVFCLPVIAKSAIVFDIKPYDDETDMTAMEQAVRSIEVDGLLWGQCKSRRDVTFTIIFFRDYSWASSSCFWY